MKNRLRTFAGALGLLAVPLNFSATPALAQARAAVVKNIDEKGRIPYIQQMICGVVGFGQTHCEVFFPVVPANKRLVVEQVNGYIETNGTVSIASIGGNPAGAQYVPFLLQSSTLENSIADNIYVASLPLLTYFEAGQTPSYDVYLVPLGSDISIFSRLTITGYLIDLTQ